MSRNAHASNKNVKEFSFKGSKEEFDKAGGNLMKMKSQGGGKTLQEMFAGGAEKLSETPEGMWQTITGNIQSGLQDAGFKILESLKPVLKSLIPVSERLGPAIAQFADKIIAVGGFLGTHLKPVAQAVGTALQEIWVASEPLRQVLGEVASIAFPALSSILSEVLVPAISYLAQVVLPVLADFVRDEVVPVLKILAGWIKDELIPGIKESAKWFKDHLAPAIQTVYKWFNDNLTPAIETVYGWFQKLAGALSSALEAVQNFGGSIRDAIGSVGSAIGGLFSAGDNSSGGSYRDGTISSHKTGLQRVPHDGFIAELHKNEAVVPAISNPYNRGNRLPAMGGMVKLAGVPAGGGTTNNNYNTFNITVTGNETDSQIDVMITKLKQKLANM